MVFPISNDTLLSIILIGLILCVVWEYRDKSVVKNGKKSKRRMTKQQLPLLAIPITSGCQNRKSAPQNENTDNQLRQAIVKSDSKLPVTETKSTKSEPDARQHLAAKIIYPFMPGCEPLGPNAEELNSKFPELSRTDIVRFLVARKGNIKLADEMIEKYLAWHNLYFPPKRKDVESAINTKCFFPYGATKDGTPIVYMRGGLYDATKATPEQYVLAAAHTIEYALKQYPDQVNVTVVVLSAHCPGGPNAPADMNFIKLFIQVLSDNYPERLKRLIMYPFPWYGRAIWSVLKVFVDKRTQDKVLLLSHSGDGMPTEAAQFLDINEMPECCGGKCKRPIVDLLTTLEEPK